MNGSYQLESFTENKQAEVKRLIAQVELFFNKEFEVYKKYGLKDGMRIIECGSGPGYLIRSIMKQLPGCAATALEIDTFLVEELKRNSVDNGLKLFDVVNGSIYDTKQPDNHFDFVFTRLVVEHLQEPDRALKELYRVLKPGGKLVVISNDFAYHILTYPYIPELDEMYSAYCNSRFSEGGNPLIGRQLPNFFKRSGFGNIAMDIVCAHSDIEGDKAFLKAENVNISKSLVKEGFLKKESLDALSEKWYKMLQHPDHVIYRQLFIICGEKSAIHEEKITNEEICYVEKTESVLFDPEKTSVADQTKLLSEYLSNKVKDFMENPHLTINVNDKLSNIDIDSLAATELSGLLRAEFKTEVNISEILSNYSISDLTDIVIHNISRSKNGLINETDISNNFTEGDV